jgi:hypothetical protein
MLLKRLRPIDLDRSGRRAKLTVGYIPSTETDDGSVWFCTSTGPTETLLHTSIRDIKAFIKTLMAATAAAEKNGPSMRAQANRKATSGVRRTIKRLLKHGIPIDDVLPDR